ncbi:MAG TPA: PucR family transcriptional regulator [Solirubrobacteraceae bacterium]|nr:PucR family transcriptional regulator [Solirubrobacteraceae bacterium]
MLTVQRLLSEVGLCVAAGQASAGAPVRSVHSTELLDPTPWLTGGELLLTTGIQLDSEQRQRDYVLRLASHGIAGIGLGVGFTHATLPGAMLEAAEERALPVFEVPYELPFMAITEHAFAHLISAQYDALRRSTEIQGRLERLVLEERGLGAITAMVAEAIGGVACVLNGRGETIAAAGTLSPDELDALRRAAADGGAAPAPLHGRALVLPVVGRESAPVQAWLAGVVAQAMPGDFERLILQQAATVVALELMRARIARDTERRLAGDVLAEALTGRLHPEELAARLRPFGLGEKVAVLAFAIGDPIAAEPLLEAALARLDARGLIAVRGSLLCAIVDSGAGWRDPIELARKLRAELAIDEPEVRAAASRAASAQSLRRSFHEARCALEAVRFVSGGAPEVASHRDLGSYHLLLSLQDDEALRSYCDSVLADIIEGDPAYSDELLRSLDAFLEHNGHWEHAAAQVFCHRHTLRYRIRRVEELTGRSLSSPRDRIEFWLALRGRELAL